MKADDDCVEAEIVSGPGAPSAGSGRPRAAAHSGSGAPGGSLYGLFLKLRLLFVSGALLVSFGLIALGLILTSTVIGALLGLPLLILGTLCLWLIFKFAAAGGQSRRFPRF